MNLKSDLRGYPFKYYNCIKRMVKRGFKNHGLRYYNALKTNHASFSDDTFQHVMALAGHTGALKDMFYWNTSHICNFTKECKLVDYKQCTKSCPFCYIMMQTENYRGSCHKWWAVKNHIKSLSFYLTSGVRIVNKKNSWKLVIRWATYKLPVCGDKPLIYIVRSLRLCYCSSEDLNGM